MTQHASWPDRLKWAEEHGLKNLQEKFTTGDNINKEAQTTLTYVLAGMAGTFGYVVQSLDKVLTSIVFSCICLCAYFTVLGLLLVSKTFFLGPFPSPYQQPKSLLARDDLSIDEVRRGELLNIDSRIDEALVWIERKGRMINLVRFLLVISPLVFLVTLPLYKWFK